jgi:hypothetical protein
VSWQEELRKLDEELASGQLSADDYRVRRDQVLSSAVGQPDAPAPESAGPDATQVIPSISPPPAAPPQQPSEADRTQAVPQQQVDPERTQAVSPWQLQQPGGDPRTQYVQPQYPASPPGGFPQAGPMSPAGGFPAWNNPEADQAPPWGGGDLPPLGASAGDVGWVQQGPESFDGGPSKGNGKKIAAIVGSVVVLVGIAVGAFLLWGPSSEADRGGQAQPTNTQQTTSPKKPDPLAVPNLPGVNEDHSDVTTFDAVAGLTYLNSDEVSTYSSAGAGPAKYIVHHLSDGNTIVLLLTQVSSAVSAQNAASELTTIQIHNGAREFGNVPDGVHASAIDAKDNDSAQVRGHYAHGNVIVRVEAHGSSLQSVETDFSTTLHAELQVLPANG